jgi:hypothetical protein
LESIMSSNPTCVPPAVTNELSGRAASDTDNGPARHDRRAHAWHRPAAVTAVAALLATAVVNSSGDPSPERMLADRQGYSVYEQDFNGDLGAVQHRTAASWARGYTAFSVADCISIGVLGVRWPNDGFDPFATPEQFGSTTSSAVAGSSDSASAAGQPADRIGRQLGQVAAVDVHEVKVRDVC